MRLSYFGADLVSVLIHTNATLDAHGTSFLYGRNSYIQCIRLCQYELLSFIGEMKYLVEKY